MGGMEFFQGLKELVDRSGFLVPYKHLPGSIYMAGHQILDWLQKRVLLPMLFDLALEKKALVRLLHVQWPDELFLPG